MPDLNPLFLTMMVTDTSIDPPLEIEVSELVGPGQPLLNLPESPGKREDTIKPLADENTQLSSDGGSIVSSCHGYPQIRVESSDRGPVAKVSIRPLLQLSADLMEARITLMPPVPPAEQVSAATLTGLLNQAGVHHGIDQRAIDQALLTVKQTGQPVSFLAARGKAPLPGKNATLRFELEIGVIPGREMADGSIDFRERNMFVPVSEGQVIARKISATNGIAGYNLAGELLEANDGQDLQVKVSDEAMFSDHDNTVRAMASGVLTLVGNDTIRVTAQHKINGDVSFATGNIRSHDAVHISGSVLPGFMVSVKGDTQVDANIQSATVNSHGNIVVKGGILGPTSIIKVQGDADIRYIERSLLQAGGNITIRISSYYSTLFAGGSIQGPDTVKLVGGEIVAGGSLTVGQIGTSAATPMTIAVGTDASRYRRYRKLQENYQQILDQTRNWYRRHGNDSTSKGIEEMEQQMATIEQEIDHFNLIPGTSEGSLGDPDAFYTEAKITVTGRIASGTIIRIGNETTRIKHELGRTRIYLDRASGAITMTSL